MTAVAVLVMLAIGSLFTPPDLAASQAPAGPQGYASYEFLPHPYYQLTDTKVLLKIHGDNAGVPKTEVIWKDPQGTVVSCGDVCTTTFEYGANNIAISATWEFYIAGYQRATGEYTAVVSVCTYYSLGSCLTWKEVALAKFYISASPQPPIMAMIPVGQYARGLDVNPQTNRVYVANGASTLSVIDGANDTVILTTTVGATPTGVGVNPITNRIYVSNADSDNVSVVDGATSAVIATIPVGFHPTSLGVNPVTNRIYVVNRWGDNVSVIDGENNTVITTLPLDGGAGAVAVNPLTNRIYVTNPYGKALSVIDGANHTITVIPLDLVPENLSLNTASNRIYVSDYGSSKITVIDGASSTVIAGEPVGASRATLIANPTTNHIFIAKSYDVAVMSGVDNTVLSTLTIGRPSAAFAVNPVTNRIYAANKDGDSVTVIQDEGPARKNLFLPVILQTGCCALPGRP